jgi:DNA-binding NarL/FixJ family response regulator
MKTMRNKPAGLKRHTKARLPRTKRGGLTLSPGTVRAITTFAETCGLTARETQVLRLACSGLKNVAIAQELDVSVPTVRLHLRNAYRKSGAESKVEFVVSAWQASLHRDGAARRTGTYRK